MHCESREMQITRNSIQHLLKVIALNYRNFSQIFTTTHITIGNHKKNKAETLGRCSFNV